MTKFDPYKPPMSASESQQLLKDAEEWELTKTSFFAELGGLSLIAAFCVAALAIWLLSLVIGPNPAGLIGFFAVMFWLWRKE